MIVIVIVSVLAVTVIHYYRADIDRANDQRLVADMDEIKKAVKMFAIQSQGIYPVSMDQLRGNFFKDIPRSPYGTEYKLDPDRGEVVCVYFKNNAKRERRVKYRMD